jgi:methylisocitrate lyase
VEKLAALGVRRISVGGGLARAAWGEFYRAAREMRDQGTFSALSRGAKGGELNALFSGG